MQNGISLKGLYDDTVQLESGLIVPRHAAADLIKSEAKKQRVEENKAAFFSKYALAMNSVSYGARAKPMNTPSFPLLYEAARKSFIDAILIRARIDQTKRIWQRANDGKSKEVGFRVVHQREDDKNYKVTKGDQERCREMEELINDPTPSKYIDIFPHKVRPHTNLKDLVGYLTQAELIIDRKCILRYPRADGKGYSAFHWLPGETIYNTDEAVREWARKNEANGKIAADTVQKVSYETGFDLARSNYVQIVDGMIVAAFTPDEISVHISNPSDQLNRFGYGVSRLEMSLDITTSLLIAFTYNRESFKLNYPENILTVAGDFDKEGLQAFKQQILSEAGGIGNNWRLPIIPAGDVDNFKIESVKLRETPKDMLFDTMIRLMCMLKAAAYGAHPSTLNMEMDSGGGGSSLFGNDSTGEIEFSKEHGLLPALSDMAEWLTDCIIHPRYDDLKIVIIGLNPEDEKVATDIRSSRVKTWMTRNEARSEEGLPPIGPTGDEAGADTNPWEYPGDVAIPNYINTFSMANQQQGDDQGGAQAGDQGDPSNQGNQDDSQYYKSLRKSKPKPETKFLKITLD